MKTQALEKVNILPDRGPDNPPPAVLNADASSIMAIITRAATDPQVDVEKIERLAGVYERMTARAAEQAFNDAMKLAQAEMPRILRDAKNSSTNSRYARLETITREINPVITKHGFSMSFGTDDSTLAGHYRVTCHVSHAAGHSRDYHVDVPADVAGARGNANKTATHGFGSTMSYGRRYLTLLIFNISLVNEDDDARAATSGDVIDANQARLLQEKLEARKVPPSAFLTWAKIDRIEDLPAVHFDSACSAIDQYKGPSA